MAQWLAEALCLRALLVLCLALESDDLFSLPTCEIGMFSASAGASAHAIVCQATHTMRNSSTAAVQQRRFRSLMHVVGAACRVALQEDEEHKLRFAIDSLSQADPFEEKAVLFAAPLGREARSGLL